MNMNMRTPRLCATKPPTPFPRPGAGVTKRRLGAAVAP